MLAKRTWRGVLICVGDVSSVIILELEFYLKLSSNHSRRDYHLDQALLRHYLQCGTRARKLRCRVRPVKMRQVGLAIFIEIRGAVVVVEVEVPIRTWINAQTCDFLNPIGTLYWLSERQDGASTNEERNDVYRCIDCNRPAAMDAFVCPKVVPVGACGHIDLAGDAALFGHGSDEQRRPEHVLVADVRDLRVVTEVHEEATHEWRSGLVRLVGQ